MLFLLPYSVQLEQSEGTWHFSVHAGLFWCFHNPPNSDMGYRIFNVCMWSFCMLIHMGYLSLWSHLKDLCEVRSGEIFKNWACGVWPWPLGFHDLSKVTGVWKNATNVLWLFHSVCKLKSSWNELGKENDNDSILYILDRTGAWVSVLLTVNHLRVESWGVGGWGGREGGGLKSHPWACNCWGWFPRQWQRWY